VPKHKTVVVAGRSMSSVVGGDNNATAEAGDIVAAGGVTDNNVAGEDNTGMEEADHA
jgi:hypothetical protein